MSDSVGIGSWAWLIILALILVAIVFALSRLGILPSRKSKTSEAAFDDGEVDGRLEVLESTPVDAERRLLLVRCDNIEHLLMVGGPADLVVENDVRKSRLVAKPVVRQGSDTAPRPAAPPADRLESKSAEARPLEAQAVEGSPPALIGAGQMPGESRQTERRPPEPRQPESRQPESRLPEPRQNEPRPAEPMTAEAKPRGARPGEAPGRLPAPSRPMLTAVPGPISQSGGRNGSAQPGTVAPAPTAEVRASEAARAGDSGEPRGGNGRMQPPDQQGNGRRENPGPPIRRTASAQPEPAGGGAVADKRVQVSPADRERPATGERQIASTSEGQAGPAKPMGLPAANSPWPEPDSVESEIVRALSAESPAPPKDGQNGPAAAPTPPAAAVAGSKGPSDPATTLGDLAERLEEALAREVESANKSRSRLDLNLDSFTFDGETPEPPAPEPRGRPQKERREPPRIMGPAPEPEVRREPGRPQSERQEEAPVISLNARRRDAVDPLEDEMARLLGELTGDTNRR